MGLFGRFERASTTITEGWEGKISMNIFSVEFRLLHHQNESGSLAKILWSKYGNIPTDREAFPSGPLT
jgi:hypothetical protein